MQEQVTPCPKKWALLIGIDRYPNLPGHDLSGCVADALAYANLLHERFEFSIDDITLLLDQQANCDGILHALAALTDRVSQDDIVVICYSGHGSQLASENQDEEDRLDETLVPYDSGRGMSPNRDIRDEELRIYLQRLTDKTTYVTVIFDCCHSESGLRDVFGDRSRGVPPDLRPRQQGARGAGRSLSRPTPAATRSLHRHAHPPYVFIAGCRAEERSYEYSAPAESGAVTHGALSFFLMRELSRATATDSIRSVFERASAQVTTARPAQHPQIEGNLSSAVFGTSSIAVTSSVRLRERSGAEATLGAGLVHGVTCGSTWAIHEPGDEAAGADKPPLGRVEVTAVSGMTSRVKIIAEASAKALDRGGRAVEDVHCFVALTLRIELAECAGAASELTAKIRQSRFLTLCSDDSAAVRIYCLPARSGVKAGDAVPQLARIDEASFIVIGRDGTLLMAPLPLGNAEKLDLGVSNLEKLARQRTVLAVENVDVASRLRDKLTLELWKPTPQGWQRAPPDGQGQYHCVEGERVALSITNRSSAPLYINLLNLGMSGGIDLLYPPPGGNAPLMPGTTIEIGRRDGEQIELFLPQDFPFGHVMPSPGAVGGMEWIKLFASRQEADFVPLLQSGVGRELADIAAGCAPPARVLAGLLSGDRDLRVRQKERDEDWTTLTCGVNTTRPAPPSSADLGSNSQNKEHA